MESKPLRPRWSASQDIDVLILVDGSESVSGDDFNKEKHLCLELASRLEGNSQLGIIQFGGKAQIVSPLSSNKEEWGKIDGMIQLGGVANLDVAIEICNSEISRSRAISNQKQLWIFTTGGFKQDPRNATLTEKLIKEKQVTAVAIGIGHKVEMRLLNRLVASGFCFLAADFPKAIKLFQYNPNKEQHCQISANFIYPSSTSIKLGETVVLRLEVQNGGKRNILQGAKAIFKENMYFKEEDVILYETLHIGQIANLYVKLHPKDLANLDTYLSLLPELIEFHMVDSSNNPISCDCTGFFLDVEDFAGDVLAHRPPQGIEAVNIMTFGPRGLGKSLFVNSICAALSDHLRVVKRDTSGALQRYQLRTISGHEQMAINLHDLSGLDDDNFKEEELRQYLAGLAGEDGSFTLAQQMHSVAFFVHPSPNEAVMEFLLKFYTQISKKCKAVILIGHSDTVLENERRVEIHKTVCRKFAIDPSNVFFLENYVDVKEKHFNVDRNILRIILALLHNAEEFLSTQIVGNSRTVDGDHAGLKNTIIDPESLPRDEKEALMLENNEMHVHITKLQGQINSLLNYKSALESLLTEDQKLALRREAPHRSIAQHVSEIVTTPISFFKALVHPPEPTTPRSRPRSNSTEGPATIPSPNTSPVGLRRSESLRSSAPNFHNPLSSPFSSAHTSPHVSPPASPSVGVVSPRNGNGSKLHLSMRNKNGSKTNLSPPTQRRVATSPR
eukprot:Phypoly_transcript_03809.p1 GENE.Phypoly_transcript_03809~~Phypoly_transcript_03809.p1  ORF type:complete len:729 (+),score=91.53 Phypoly_transcript_03809:75-2261(+)